MMLGLQWMRTWPFIGAAVVGDPTWPYHNRTAKRIILEEKNESSRELSCHAGTPSGAFWGFEK